MEAFLFEVGSNSSQTEIRYLGLEFKLNPLLILKKKKKKKNLNPFVCQLTQLTFRILLIFYYDMGTMPPCITNQVWIYTWVPVSSTGEVSDGCIRDLGFNHQERTS